MSGAPSFQANPERPQSPFGFLWAFIKLQFSAAIFGIGILTLIMVTSMIWQDNWPVHRYDFLFAVVVIIQVALLVFGMETWAEARVIIVFHIVGVVMEIFKVAAGSWVYPEPGFFKVLGVPLFTGFMYSAVGSYIARGWRLTGMRLTGAPPEWQGGLLAFFIYSNFFMHHFIADFREVLFVLIGVIYGRCWAEFTRVFRGRVPILVLFGMVALLVYAAENIGSLSGTWLYPNQHSDWHPVPIGKLGAWFLLMIISFTLVRWVQPDEHAPHTKKGTERL